MSEDNTTTNTVVSIKSMKLVIDHRERAVAECLVRQLVEEEEKEGHGEEKKAHHPRPSVAALDVGDFQIVEEEEGEVPSSSSPRVIFERKTLGDMCASIKDGRYREQKARLFGSGLANSRGREGEEDTRVVYVLEGCISYDRDLRQASVDNGLNPSTLQSCVHNLMFRDGIFVVFASDIRDTAGFVRETWKRYRRVLAERVARSRHAAASSKGGGGSCNSDAVSSALMGSAAHSKRNKNITHRTCFLMQLCQFPGVSEKTALTISDRWGSMQRLYEDLLCLSEKERVDSFSSVPGIGKVNARKLVEFAFPETPKA